MAAVFPAQPEPMMMTLCIGSLMLTNRSLTVTARLQACDAARLGKDAGTHHLVGDQRAEVGEKRHVGELDGGPFPAAGFAPNHGNSGHALHREGEENQKCDGAAGTQIASQRLAEPLRFRRAFLAVDGAESSDD